MNAAAAVPRMEVTATFVVRNVRAFDFDHAKEVAKNFAHSYLFGKQFRAEARREADGLYTVEFR